MSLRVSAENIETEIVFSDSLFCFMKNISFLKGDAKTCCMLCVLNLIEYSQEKCKETKTSSLVKLRDN